MGRKFCHSTKCLILYHFVLCTGVVLQTILDVYIYIILSFLFSLFVFVSAAGQYNVIWTGTGLPRFRFGSGMVLALLF